MNRLDDSDYWAYRADLLAEAVAERFGVVHPWREMHAKPLPMPRPLTRVTDKARTTAARRRALNAAMADPIDASGVRAA